MSDRCRRQFTGSCRTVVAGQFTRSCRTDVADTVWSCQTVVVEANRNKCQDSLRGHVGPM
ncbi:unnamed protein product [Camellia sinensis]